MKTLLVLMLMCFFASDLYACSYTECTPIQAFIKKNYGVMIDMDKDIRWLAYRGSSKSDYAVALSGTNCLIKLRVKSHNNRVKVKELSSHCRL